MGRLQGSGRVVATTIPKPAGPYAEEMLEGGGWPEVDETVLSDRGDQLVQHLRQLTSSCSGVEGSVYWSTRVVTAGFGVVITT